MPPPKRMIHLGSWVLLLLLNVAGALTFFQKPDYLPIDAADVMLVRPGPTQDASAAATIASGQGNQIATPQPPVPRVDEHQDLVGGLRLPLVCLSSVLLITLILLTRTWPAKKPLPPESV